LPSSSQQFFYEEAELIPNDDNSSVSMTLYLFNYGVVYVVCLHGYAARMSSPIVKLHPKCSPAMEFPEFIECRFGKVGFKSTS